MNEMTQLQNKRKYKMDKNDQNSCKALKRRGNVPNRLDASSINLIMANLYHKEQKEKYPTIQNEYTKLRTNCIHYMVQITQKLGFCIETLFKAVLSLDMYCQTYGTILQNDPKLVCMTIINIVAKMEEVILPFGETYLHYMGHTNNTLKDLATMEQQILFQLNFQFCRPHIYTFLSYYIATLPITLRSAQLAVYYAHRLLLHHHFLTNYRLSLLALACIYLAEHVLVYPKKLASISILQPYTENQVRGVAKDIYHIILAEEAEESKDAIRDKFSLRHYGAVALLKVPNNLSFRDPEISSISSYL